MALTCKAYCRLYGKTMHEHFPSFIWLYAGDIKDLICCTSEKAL